MRVAIVGAGALGSVYGAHLACLGGCEVDLIARRRAPPAVVRVVRVESGEALEWAAPERHDRVPLDADVVVVCVRYEQLAGIVGTVAGAAPIVVMTPMMPQEHSRLSAALPGRVVAAMPGVLAYLNEPSTVRYWLPRGVATLIETRSPAGRERELALRLATAGIRAELEPDVLARNVATTVSFAPLAMALDIGGGIDAVLADRRLLALGVEAADEGRELGRAIGNAEPWASALLHFARPFVLKIGVALARSRFSEAVTYVEHHFGRKLHTQNVLLAQRIIELAKQKGTPCVALERLLARLKTVTPRQE